MDWLWRDTRPDLQVLPENLQDLALAQPAGVMEADVEGNAAPGEASEGPARFPVLFDNYNFATVFGQQRRSR